MARANDSTESILDLRSVGYFSDSGVATTLSGDEAAGETSLSVASETGFTQDSIIRLGANGSSCDVGKIASTAASTIVVDHGLYHGQLSGAAVTQLTFVDMGHTTEAGASIEITGNEQIFNVGTQVGTYIYSQGSNETAFGFSLVCASPENFLQALGVAETGVLTTPAGAYLDPNAFGSLPYKPWMLQGLDQGGLTVTFIFASAKVAVPNTTIPFSTGTMLEIPMTLRWNNYCYFTRE